MTYADVLELNRRQPRRLAAAPACDERERGDAMPGAAGVLAYAGAFPLLAAALMIVARPEAAAAPMGFMIIFGGALIAFFGGVRWGVAVMKPGGPTMRALLGGALPLALAIPVFLPWAPAFKLVYIMVVLAVLLVDDLGATRRGDGAPAWYLGVRAPLTVLMEVAYLTAFVRLAA